MTVKFAPASLKQKLFLESNADVIVFGGSAGGGKTYVSLMRFLRWVQDPKFFGYVFRKESTSMRGGGGAFDESQNIFPVFDRKCKVTTQPMRHRFQWGSSIDFIGMDGNQGKNKVQGKQISAAMIDEATHFTEDEIDWIISRLRTQAKMIPNIWLTCNPDPDSYIYKWIAPYYLYPKGSMVDGKLVEGRPIPERNGKITYFLKVDGKREWAETKQELLDKFQHLYGVDENGESECKPMSFQFIGATVYDNPPLLKADPAYVNKLQNLDRVTKERLLYGNWEARVEGAGYFSRTWCGETIVGMPPSGEIIGRVRAFDLAGTKPNESNPNPDYTVGVLMAKTVDGEFIVEDVQRIQEQAGKVEKWVLDLIEEDKKFYGQKYKAFIPIDPAQAGLAQKTQYAKAASKRGMAVYFFKNNTQGGKVGAFEPFAAAAQHELVKIKRGDWNDEYFYELEAFDGSRSTSTRKDD